MASGDRPVFDPEKNHRHYDTQLGCLSVEISELQKSVEALTKKVDELMEVKNKGLGVLIAVGSFAGAFGWIAKDWLKAHL